MQPVAKAAAPKKQHCRQLADVAWHQTEANPGWFGTVLFQAGPKYYYLTTISTKAFSGSCSWLKQPLSALLYHEAESTFQ